MRLFIKKFILFTLLISSVFLSIVLINFYFVNKVQISTKEKTILILGDSNAECAVNDSIFNQSINFSSSSDSYFYSYLKLKKLTKDNENIDTLFLSFSPHNIFDNGWLSNGSQIYSRFKIYYPLMNFKDVLFLLKVNPKQLIKSTPSISKHFFINIVDFMKGKPLLPGEYQALNTNILKEVQAKLKNDEELPFFKIPKTFDVSIDEITYLNKIIAYCNEKKIKLFFVNFPKRKELLKYAKYGVKQFNTYYDLNYSKIDYLDFSSFSMPDSCYGDFVHLNISGSTFFSTYLKDNGIVKLKEKYKRIAKNTVHLAPDCR